jgi:hypothetical protein
MHPFLVIDVCGEPKQIFDVNQTIEKLVREDAEYQVRIAPPVSSHVRSGSSVTRLLTRRMMSSAGAPTPAANAAAAADDLNPPPSPGLMHDAALATATSGQPQHRRQSSSDFANLFRNISTPMLSSSGVVNPNSAGTRNSGNYSNSAAALLGNLERDDRRTSEVMVLPTVTPILIPTSPTSTKNADSSGTLIAPIPPPPLSHHRRQSSEGMFSRIVRGSSLSTPTATMNMPSSDSDLSSSSGASAGVVSKDVRISFPNSAQ